MTIKKVLITGGAGCIGSHLADELLSHGYEVRAFDNLSAQVHGPDAGRPDYLHEERLCLLVGRAYNIPTVALRFFNVYGTRQALSNPYTGVLAIFASRFLNNNAPMIFEDGQQQRDFVHVKDEDVALACRLALKKDEANGQVFNVGSGNNYTISEIAERLAAVLGKEHLVPELTGKYRVGDIRHCYADMSLAQQQLGFYPQVEFDRGLEELAAWLAGQIAYDRVSEASAELAARSLTV